MKTTMVNAPKQNFSPLPAGRYGKSKMRSTQRCRQANEDKSGLKAERIQTLGVLRSSRFKKKLTVEKQRAMHSLSIEAKENWIEDCVERDTAGARKQVENAGAAVQPEHDDMTHAEIQGLTTREPE
jgi:hypothetical protein